MVDAGAIQNVGAEHRLHFSQIMAATRNSTAANDETVFS
jgi:hypothetical protein